MVIVSCHKTRHRFESLNELNHLTPFTFFTPLLLSNAISKLKTRFPSQQSMLKCFQKNARFNISSDLLPALPKSH